jgi:MFS family permease
MDQRELASPTGQLRRLSILIAASCVDMIGFAMILPLLPFYALDLKASPTVIGMIISSFSVAQLLSAPAWGRVSDRHGRRPALLIGLAASAAAYLVFGLANAVWLLFASRIIQGAGGGTTGVAQAYVADTVPPENRARALGWLSAATSAGVMVGPVVGSFAAHWGQAAPGLVAAVLCLINVAFAWKWLPESKALDPVSPTKARKRPVWSAAAGILRRPHGMVPRLIWIYAVGMLAFSGLTSILSLYLGAQFGFTEKSIGYVFLYIGLLSLVMRSLCLGPIVDWVGETWAMRIGTLTLVFGLAAYAAVGNRWTLAAVMPFVPIGTALLFPSTTALMSRASDKAELGVIMGIAQTYAGIARMIAPLIATFTFQHFGHAVPFYAAAATVALVGVLAFQIKPGSKPRTFPS